jgi:hypothetical protein
MAAADRLRLPLLQIHNNRLSRAWCNWLIMVKNDLTSMSLGVAGVKNILLVFGQVVTQHHLDLKQGNVQRVGNSTFHLDLERLTNVNHGPQTKLRQFQRGRQGNFQL